MSKISSIKDSEHLRNLIVTLLEDKKAMDIQVVDFRGKSPLTDFVIVASGTSGRHVTSLAELIREEMHRQRLPILSIEGLPEGDWVLVDLNDVIVHLFKPEVRALYDLEKMWTSEEMELSPKRKTTRATPS